MVKEMNEEIRDLELFTGNRCGISLCCIDFYELSWLPSIKHQIPEYSETMWEFSNETGVLLCPECMLFEMEIKSASSQTSILSEK